jgi:hypothetical protein
VLATPSAPNSSRCSSATAMTSWRQTSAGRGPARCR